MSKFKKSEAELASSPELQIFKFQREDWALFRTIEGLQQRAGVPKGRLRRLVLKELADNGLDNGADVRVGELQLPDGGGYYVEDNGSGIDPTEVASLFSIDRPMVSSKLWRLPTRGALGNGLRVVAGAVLAAEGSLSVITRNQRIKLRPEHDGTTTVVSMKPVKFPVGTRIEINLGALPADPFALDWALTAIMMSGKSYAGKTSPWWYDAPTFHELLLAAGDRPVRDLIASLDGCTGAKAGEIVASVRLGRTICTSVTREQAERLLRAAREHARPVSPSRLTGVGPELGDAVYAGQRGEIGGIPYLIEAWASPDIMETTLSACVNRTPVTTPIDAAREKRDIDAFGCGLSHTIAVAPKDKHFRIWLNVITPYMPITSDGKAPNLEVFLDPITKAVSSAVRKAHIPNSANGTTQKSIVLDNLDEAIAKVSGDGEYRFNQRQILYVLRPIVRDELDEELTVGNFGGIITEYESENGEIEGMYREPRGSIYHPHREETITLGTLMVENYERPAWLFNKVVYIEKEGFSEALKDERWAEQHDCMLMSSKGYTTRAARDLVDKLAEHDEPATIFCVHDADAYGTMIYQTFQEATKARDARKITIINFGLEPWEAIAMGLEVETVKAGDRLKPVANYVLERDAASPGEAPNGEDWADWLQTHRVELNAMTTPQFIEWLDGKMAGYDKLIPPAEVLEQELADNIEKRIRAAATERILREAGLENQVTEAMAAITKPDADTMRQGIKDMFEQESDREWRDHINRLAEEASEDKKDR